MSDSRFDEQFASIFSESVEQASRRERNAFDEIAGACAGSIVLYGAGNLGRRVLRGLRKNRLDPIAFADANPALRDQRVDGIPVFSPKDAVREYADSAVFVVCVWHPDRRHSVYHIMNAITEMGARRVTSFVPLFWKYPDTFLPYFFWDLPSNLVGEGNSVQECYLKLSDDASRSYLLDNLRFRSHGDFSPPSRPSELPAYFPRELFRVSNDECFVDCGAFDGDTIRGFVDQTQGKFRRIVAFEPDPHNFRALQQNFLSAEGFGGRAIIHNAAVAARRGKVHFNATGFDDAAVTKDGELEVDCTTLDESLVNENPTFIKMDIEGSEYEALSGGRNTIGALRPILAVSVYHRPSDLWTLPIYMQELQPESQLSLRMYWHDGFDLVCFAVPSARAMKSLP